MTAIRFGFATVVFVLMLRKFEGAGALRTEGRLPHVFLLGIVGVIGGVLLMVVGLTRTRAEHAAVIVAAQPLMAAMVAWVAQGRRPPRQTLVSITIALFGVALVITRGNLRNLHHDGSVLGDATVVGAVFCWVAYTLAARAFPLWSPLRYTTLTVATGAAVVICLTGLAAGVDLIVVPTTAQLRSVGWELFYITVVSALLGTLCWNSGIRRIGADGVLFINFVPVTAFAVGAFQGYRFNWAELLGAAAVLVALVVNQLWSRPSL